MQGVQATPWGWVREANVQYGWDRRDRKVAVGITIPARHGCTHLLAKRESEVVIKMAVLVKPNDCCRKICVWERGNEA